MLSAQLTIGSMRRAMRLWIETTHHAAFRYGGWAYARETGGAVTGMAGGERNITRGASIDLFGLVAAMQDRFAPAAGVTVAVKRSRPGWSPPSPHPRVAAAARIRWLARRRPRSVGSRR